MLNTKDNIYPWLKQPLDHFISLYEANKFPKVVLLYGNQGTGKSKLATSIADVLNSNSYQLLETDDLKIDNIRKLIDTSFKTNLLSDKNVNILLNIENLTESAANALLKILESESVTTYFILTASNYHNVKPTILSRCYKFDVRIINKQLAKDWLSEHQVQATDMELLLELTNNSPILALEYYNNEYLTKISECITIVEQAKKINISSNAKRLVELFTSKDSNNKTQFDYDGYLLLMSYITTKRLPGHIESATQRVLQNHLILEQKNNNIGIKTEGYNLAFNFFYQLSYN